MSLLLVAGDDVVDDAESQVEEDEFEKKEQQLGNYLLAAVLASVFCFILLFCCRSWCCSRQWRRWLPGQFDGHVSLMLLRPVCSTPPSQQLALLLLLLPSDNAIIPLILFPPSSTFLSSADSSARSRPAACLLQFSNRCRNKCKWLGSVDGGWTRLGLLSLLPVFFVFFFFCFCK